MATGSAIGTETAAETSPMMNTAGALDVPDNAVA